MKELESLKLSDERKGEILRAYQGILDRKAFVLKYLRDRRRVNPNFKIKCILRCRLLLAIKYQGGRKSAPTFELLGCDVSWFRGWLEKKFQPGMTWDNHGRWHIDHIIPCIQFDLTKPEHQRQCFHYSNLQPLWAFDNLRKAGRVESQY